jgi:hypothetical protein
MDNNMVIELNGKPILWSKDPIVVDHLEIEDKDYVPEQHWKENGTTELKMEGKVKFVPRTAFQKAHAEWYQRHCLQDFMCGLFGTSQRRRVHKNRTKILNWNRNHKNNKKK